MTTVDPNFAESTDREARRAQLFTRINTADKWFQVLGLAWLTPMLKAAAGDTRVRSWAKSGACWPCHCWRSPPS